MRLRPRVPVETGGYALDLADPYISDDDNLSVALIWNRHVNNLTIADLKNHLNCRMPVNT